MSDQWWSFEGSSWAAYRKARNRSEKLLISQKLTLASDLHESARLRAARTRSPDAVERAEEEMLAARVLVDRYWKELRSRPRTAQLAITAQVFEKTGRTIPWDGGVETRRRG